MALIFLFTDFGRDGPYLGQVEAVLARRAPEARVINLCSDVEPFAPKAAAYLLAAYAPCADEGDIIVGVIDPGVGTARAGIVVNADDRWFVGPDNGLFALVARRAVRVQAWQLPAADGTASATFHGRDIFAPVAARLVREGADALQALGATEIDPKEVDQASWPDEWDAVIYIDRFGNAMTGRRAQTVSRRDQIVTKNLALSALRTFGDGAKGAPFWYANSNGLIEIAVNSGRACDVIGLSVGDAVALKHA